MSELRVNSVTSSSGNESPNFTKGLRVTGVVTATSFSGSASGLTGNFGGSAGGLTAGATGSDLNLSGIVTAIQLAGNVTGTAATFSGDVTVGGVLTYDDVTNIDSIGLVTARNGLQVLAGITTIYGQATTSNIEVTSGIATVTGQTALANVSVSAAATVTGALSAAGQFSATGGVNVEDLLKEEVNVTAGKLSDNTNIDLEDGMAHLFTTTETTTATPNIRVNSSTTLNSVMATGDVISVSIITTAAAAGYAATVHIDGATVGTNGGTLSWNGGSAPSAGGASGKDLYSYSIVKTASATYTVLANLSNFA